MYKKLIDTLFIQDVVMLSYAKAGTVTTVEITEDTASITFATAELTRLNNESTFIM